MLTTKETKGMRKKMTRKINVNEIRWLGGGAKKKSWGQCSAFFHYSELRECIYKKNFETMLRFECFHSYFPKHSFNC